MFERAAGRLGSARELLERSVELREQVGFQPGVAANLIGLAYIAAADGRDADARMLMDRAAAIVEEYVPGLAGQIQEARSELAR